MKLHIATSRGFSSKYMKSFQVIPPPLRALLCADQCFQGHVGCSRVVVELDPTPRLSTHPLYHYPDLKAPRYVTFQETVYLHVFVAPYGIAVGLVCH